MLLTNLSFTLSDQALRVIAVTSSVPGEGKSFVAANARSSESSDGLPSAVDRCRYAAPASA